MADTIIQFNDDSGNTVPVLAVDNGDGTYSLSVDAALEVGSLTIGKVDQGAAGVADWKITLDSETVTVSGIASNYLGQQVLSFTSATNQNATLPTGTKGIWVTSENNPAYLAVNTTAAPTTAGIYAPKDVTKYIGPYNGITSLGVYAASGVYVHLVYES